ncbi:MAG: hypothetical protein FWE20_02730 [Defluviitaleaceae bacterium]|nr:hypothetical protein [Defluviitaleaceae bacterium]
MFWHEIFYVIFGAVIASIAGVVSGLISEHIRNRKQLKHSLNEILFHTNNLVDSFNQSKSILINGIDGDKIVPIAKNKFFQANDYFELMTVLSILKTDFADDVREIKNF